MPLPLQWSLFQNYCGQSRLLVDTAQSVVPPKRPAKEKLKVEVVDGVLHVLSF